MTDNQNDKYEVAYASASVFDDFIKLIRKKTLDHIDVNLLKVNGNSSYGAYSILTSAKALDLIDAEGNAKEKLRKLSAATNDQLLQNALREIVRDAYSDVFDVIPEEDMTSDKVEHYFRLKGISNTTATKAARFFIWITGKAGIDVPGKVESRSREVRERTSQNMLKRESKISSDEDEINSSNNVTSDLKKSKPIPKTDFTSEDFEDTFLQILLAKIQETDGVPDSEIINQIRDMIREKKERERQKLESGTNENLTKKEEGNNG